MGSSIVFSHQRITEKMQKILALCLIALLAFFAVVDAKKHNNEGEDWLHKASGGVARHLVEEAEAEEAKAAREHDHAHPLHTSPPMNCYKIEKESLYENSGFLWMRER